MAFMGGAALLGAASAIYIARKVFGGNNIVEEEKKCELPTVYMPGIVSDIDGVVVKGNDVVPGTRETMIKLLTPSKTTERRVPFTFLSNGGGQTEHEKAEKMNK